MSLNQMAQRMSLEVPGIATAYARTLLNEALGQIEDSRMWSFQLADSGWLTPGILFASGAGSLSSAGSVTFTPYSDQVIGDAAASAAWAAYVGTPPLTVFQIRNAPYAVYSIVGYDDAVNAPFGTFTLDRPWMEPGGANQPYMIYQCYFPAPTQDFKRFFDIFDTTNGFPLDYWTLTQKDLSIIDPQRLVFDQPTNVVPYQTDQRANSSTLGYMLYELWPHPTSIRPYPLHFLRRGPQLVKPADTVPSPLTEEVVIWQAKENAYLWKEAQKGEDIARGSGADYRFLAQAAVANYKRALKPLMDRDRDQCELYFARLRRGLPNAGQPYSTVTGQLNVGDF